MRYKVEYRNKKNGIYPRVEVTHGGTLLIYDKKPKTGEYDDMPLFRLRSICPPDGYRSVFVIYGSEEEGWQ